MKNILLLVHDDDGQEARLQAALDLTRTLEGHLTCLDVAALPMVAADYYAGMGEAILLADERERESKNKVALEARLMNEDVTWSWIDSSGPVSDCILKAATLADIIVLNRKLDGFPYPDMHEIASRVVTQARKPVVAVPDSLRRFDMGRALIAWDGQSSAAATMRAAVPLLALASEVEILTVNDGAARVDPTHAAEYLSRHGIHAVVKVIDDVVHVADTVIIQEAKRWRADYILMGAYGRGRMMETFGGITRRMLASSDLPLILGH